MNKTRFFSAVLALAVLAGTTPALALSFGASSKADISVDALGNRSDASARAEAYGRDGRNDDKKRDGWSDDRSEASMRYWKNWAFNAGIAGTVTATGGDIITIESKSGKTYTVDTSDAQIRGSTVETGDRVYVQGVTNDSEIVATLVINGKEKDAALDNDDSRTGIMGTVTAKTDTTLTVLGKDGTVYTVSTADATVWINGEEDDSTANIETGDSVVVQGRTDDDTVDATKIVAVSFPARASDGGIRGTVTAVNGENFTLMVSGGMTYTVDADSAAFEDRKGKEQERDDIKAGEMVIVTGDVSGSTIDADVVAETKLNRGFFYRVKNFFVSVFGNGSVQAR